jgi:hypothetical protein
MVQDQESEQRKLPSPGWPGRLMHSIQISLRWLGAWVSAAHRGQIRGAFLQNRAIVQYLSTGGGWPEI